MFFEFDPMESDVGTNDRRETGSALPIADEWGGDLMDDFVRESAKVGDAPAVERLLATAARRLMGIGSTRFVPLSKRGLVPGFETAVVAARPGARIWGWLVVDEPIEDLGGRAGVVRRRLEMLGRIAAGILDRLAMAPRVEPPAPARPRGFRTRADSPTAGAPVPIVHDETFLLAVLPLFFNQAERYSEPLAMLCVAIDRIEGIRSLLGADQADRTTRDVGLEIAARIRSSDFAARLDDGRIEVVLPRSEMDGALTVAGKIRRAVAESADLIRDTPGLTVSIGAAAYPSRAQDSTGLRAAAVAALHSARALGGNRVEPAPHRARHVASCEVEGPARPGGGGRPEFLALGGGRPGG